MYCKMQKIHQIILKVKKQAMCADDFLLLSLPFPSGEAHYKYMMRAACVSTGN